MNPERIEAFIHSFDEEMPEYLNRIEEECRRTNVPVIRPQMQSLLKLFLTMKQPVRILEVGTAIGFSALLMSEYAPKNCLITTIEQYEKRIPIARAHFAANGRENQITLLEGDAAILLKELSDPYDFIFMDAAKAQYIHYLPEVLRLLKPGAILISDNILQDGDILESRFAVTRRNRTIHARMRQYLYELKHCPELETAILQIGDGATVSVRKGQ